ncbi:MAG: antA/AntB antirepressor family protein [Candidatus Shapirobacteria bacterium]|jgi:phage anti-repressor protein
MIQINENGKIEGRELHRLIESKTKQYNVWITRAIIDADLKEPKDFCTILYESTGGRPRKEYEFTIEAAKEICLMERNNRGKEIRKWLIELSRQKENLELITVKEAAFAVKVINCLKYIENQKQAYSMHQAKFLSDNIDILNPKYIYSEFAKYRTNIVGWDKQSIDSAIDKFLAIHPGYNKQKIDKSNMQTKLSIMDIGEAIRVACLDILFSKEENEHLANRFSILCKNLANEMKIQVEKRNETNLFHEKKAIENINNLKLE